MNKLILLLIISITHIGIGYASFPTTVYSSKCVDTLQADELEQYHSSLIKMGIDVNSCKCPSCRSGVKTDIEKKSKNNKAGISIWIKILIMLTVLSIIFMILIWKWMEDFNKSGGIGVG